MSNRNTFAWGGLIRSKPPDRRDGRRRRRPPATRPRVKPPIQDIFRRGDEVLVQVIKEGIGAKGPTLSTYISIPGRYLVLMPALGRVGVSRKIEDDEARRRLRDLLFELNPPKGLGFIVRTAGQERSRRELSRDLAYLLRLWKVIVRRVENHPGPIDIYEESDMIIRTIRDIFSSDVDAIYIDELAAYERAKEFLQSGHAATRRTFAFLRGQGAALPQVQAGGRNHADPQARSPLARRRLHRHRPHRSPCGHRRE